MNERERTVFAAVEALAGAVLAIGGFVAVARGAGVITLVGIVLLVFAAVGLAQAVAAGLGLYTPPARPPSEEDDDGRDK
jgi:O-antigen/teichoic acid export membrane protein